jgi:peroxiredoxin
VTSYYPLPEGLPAPVDDAAADHLIGQAMPQLAFSSTEGDAVDLATLRGRTIVYLYPKTGRPGVEMPDGWDAIPGARGCTPESCGFRDHYQDIINARASVFGFSSQDTAYQSEMAKRLGLPFPVLSDPDFLLDASLNLPTFEAASERLYTRLTMAILNGLIEHVWYPVFPTDTHAEVVVRWLASR